MQKQLKIFYNLVSQLKQDSTVESVLLNGSVALGTATELSDLDIIVICEEKNFISKIIDGITVEIHYITFDDAVEKLKNNPMEVYRYLDSKVEYDSGKAQKIIECAETILNNYRVVEKEKREIVYWLKSTKLKLESALFKQDMLLISYLVSTNTWMVLQGVWAVNQMPIPPSSSLYRRYDDLKLVPCDKWFEKLLTGTSEQRAKIMLKTIEWILINI